MVVIMIMLYKPLWGQAGIGKSIDGWYIIVPFLGITAHIVREPNNG